MSFRTLLILTATNAFVAAAPFDHSLWDKLLKKYVHVGDTLQGITLNTVDYSGISSDADFSTYITQLSSANITGFNKNDTYAFFINAYNALAVHMITSNPCEKDLFGECGPIGSIKDIGSVVPYRPVWGMTAGTLAGKDYSLDDIEGYLRDPSPFDEDPRLHAAIVCASISCPNLRPEAYTSERIDYQLTDNFNNLILNTNKGMDVDQSNSKVTLSMIFKWYEDDFINYMKTSDDYQVIEFILTFMYQNDTRFHWLVDNKASVSLHYFDYDWDLNVHGDVPCSSKDRACYPLWALLTTLGSFAVCILITAGVIVCVRRRRARKGYERINENDT